MAMVLIALVFVSLTGLVVVPALRIALSPARTRALFRQGGIRFGEP